jgi:GxxExxY protein
VDTPEDRILNAVFNIGLMIHRAVGPGLLESVYETILAHELVKAGYEVRRQVDIPMTWDNLNFERGFRADLIVDDLVIIEVKAVEVKHAVHARQLLTYLKMTGKRLGAVVNFGLELFKDGFERVANGMPD